MKRILDGLLEAIEIFLDEHVTLGKFIPAADGAVKYIMDQMKQEVDDITKKFSIQFEAVRNAEPTGIFF